MKNLLQAALQPPHNLLEAAQGNALFAPLQPMQSRGWQAYFLGKLRVSHFPALLAEKLAELIFQSVRHPKTLQKNPFQMWNNSWPAF